jgi:archaellum component FlaF (FlaF/FlaG flagellin family)
VFVEKMIMKNAIIAFLICCMGILYIQNLSLNRRLNHKATTCYQTNLSREEMKLALFQVANDSISVMIPGDTSVMPYLIKSVKEVPCEVARR